MIAIMVMALMEGRGDEGDGDVADAEKVGNLLAADVDTCTLNPKSRKPCCIPSTLHKMKFTPLLILSCDVAAGNARAGCGHRGQLALGNGGSSFAQF